MQSETFPDDLVRPVERPADTGTRRRDLKVISRQPLEAAFALALERSMRRHAPAVSASVLDRVRGDAFREFLSLVKRRVRNLRGVPKSEFLAELERSHNVVLKKRDEARAELARLRIHAEVFRHLDEVPPGTGQDDVLLGSTMSEGIRTLFERAEKGELDPGTLREEIALVATEVAHADKERSLAEYDRQIDLFQRRIVKLNASLERSERTLSEMSSRSAHDPGIASVYRTVQGLSPRDDFWSVKQELLLKLFEANLVLQERAS